MNDRARKLLDDNSSRSYAELMLRFARWFDEQSNPVTPHDIRRQFGVSTSTAYRWLQAINDASNLPAAV